MADQFAAPTLEDLARSEAKSSAEREAKKEKYRLQQEQLFLQVPPRFFTLARQIRDGVGRFNGAAKLERAIVYSETTAVATRDTNLASDFFVDVKRAANRVSLALRQLRRLRLPDALIIEGEGQIGTEPSITFFRLRIDGLYRNDELRWRVVSDGREVDTPIDELADRLVAVIATGEFTRLWTTPPFVDNSAGSKR